MRSIFFTLAIAAVTVAQVVYPENETNENRKPQGHVRLCSVIGIDESDLALLEDYFRMFSIDLF